MIGGGFLGLMEIKENEELLEKIKEILREILKDLSNINNDDSKCPDKNTIDNNGKKLDAILGDNTTSGDSRFLQNK